VTASAGIIHKILPREVVAVEELSDPPEACLFAAEEYVIARAVDKRRREFITGRYCAHRAMASLGIEPAPLLASADGAPQWPAGVVGSITHCDGYRAAAVARLSEVFTVGIDAEPHLPLPAGVLDVISLPSERTMLGELVRLERHIHWDRLLFAVKESLYKSWFPVTRKWLGFDDAEITIRAHDRRFTVRLLVPNLAAVDGSKVDFSGRWLVSERLIVTAVTVPRPVRT
jgi:4'-phosphopantetheinyl transferase EntD